MSKRELVVGAIVHIRHVAASAATYRIAELLLLDNGIILYKVKSETEPFDRIVAEPDLALDPQRSSEDRCVRP